MYRILSDDLFYNSINGVPDGFPFQVTFEDWNGLVQLLKDAREKYSSYSARLLLRSPLASNVFISSIDLVDVNVFTEIDEEFVQDLLRNVMEELVEESSDSAKLFVQVLGIGSDNVDVFLSQPIEMEIQSRSILGSCSKKTTKTIQRRIGNITISYKQIPSRNHDCGIQALRFFNQNLPSVALIRKLSKLRGPISVRNLEKLSRVVQTPVIVIQQQGGKLYTVTTGELVEHTPPFHCVLLRNNHYYPVVHIAKPTNTCPDCGNPECAGGSKCPVLKEKFFKRKRLRSSRRDLFWDIETHRILSSRVAVDDGSEEGGEEYTQAAVLCVAYIPSENRTEVFQGTSCMTEFIKFLDNSKTPYRCYAHNGGAFDNYFVLSKLLQQPASEDFVRDNLTLRGSKILSMYYKDHIFLDTMNHLNASLERLSHSFNIKNKKKVDFVINGEAITNEYFFNCANDVDAEDYIDKLRSLGALECFIEYCKYDCYSLAEIWGLYKQSMNTILQPIMGLNVEIFKDTIHNALTAPSASKKFWMTTMAEQPMKPDFDSYIFKLCDKAIIGGISYISEPCHVTNVTCVDVVSLYVWAMLHNEFPIGEPIETDLFVPGKLGIYECSDVRCTPFKICDIPSLTNDGLDWSNPNSTNRVLSSVDIERIINNGGDCIVTKGVYWETTSNCFGKYLTPITNEKKRQDTLKGTESYNQVIREICKLLGNALYGKTMERKKKTQVNVVESLYDIDDADFKNCFVSKVGNKYIVRTDSVRGNQSPLYIGVFVLAFSRNLMMSFFDAIGRNNVIAAETDSIYFDVGLKHCFNQFVGKEIGQLSYDFDVIDEAYFLSKKAYALRIGDTFKYRCKGVPNKKLAWHKYEEWYQKGVVSFDKILTFNRNLFTTATISIGSATKKLKLNKS